MVDKSISSLIIDKFGLNLYQKSLNFLSNKNGDEIVMATRKKKTTARKKARA